MRKRFKNLAEIVNDDLPDCREKAEAMTNLEYALFNVNAAIARRIT